MIIYLNDYITKCLLEKICFVFVCLMSGVFFVFLMVSFLTGDYYINAKSNIIFNLFGGKMSCVL